jgi:hypothetical protein
VTDQHIEDFGEIERADERWAGFVAEDRLNIVERGLAR